MNPLEEVGLNEDNPEPRQALVLLLDTSKSMDSDIQELNEGLALLQEGLQSHENASKRVEVCIVTFGGEVRELQPFVEAARFEAPQLTTGGRTPMGSAILHGLAKTEDRKSLYRSSGLDYYRPWIFLITDGYPTDAPEKWVEAVQAVHAAESAKKVAFFAVGTSSADFSKLAEATSSARPPKKLADNKWHDMFQWLSKSMQAQSNNRTDQQAPLDRPEWTAD